MLIPEIIGEPEYAERPDGGPIITAQTELARQTFPIVYLTPTAPSKADTGTLEVYKGDPGKGAELFKQIMDAVNVDSSKVVVSGLSSEGTSIGIKAGLKVMINYISPFSETYTNNYSQNTTLANLASGSFGENIQDTLRILTGGKTLSESSDTVKKIEEGAASLAQKAGMSAEGSKTLASVMANPNAKLDFPMMWRGSSYSAAYEISIRLINSFPNSDKTYEDRILAPLAALMAFVLPISGSQTGVSYETPLMCQFKVPGLVYLQDAFVSNMSVVKGGDVNDISWTYRPNIIDIRMSIQSLRNTMTADKAPGLRGGIRLANELKALRGTSSKLQKPKNLSDLLPPGNDAIQNAAPGNVNAGNPQATTRNTQSAQSNEAERALGFPE